jgi:hypothetical protein
VVFDLNLVLIKNKKKGGIISMKELTLEPWNKFFEKKGPDKKKEKRMFEVDFRYADNDEKVQVRDEVKTRFATAFVLAESEVDAKALLEEYIKKSPRDISIMQYRSIEPYEDQVIAIEFGKSL